VIDARGMRCPWPALRLARAIRGGARDVEVIADDPIAPGELAAVAAAQGLTLVTLDIHRFRVFSA
jgi:tRNA 2-thiouridine synthesizing protein A